MSAEKREDLARTKQYDYGSGGWAAERTRLMVKRMSWFRSWSDVLVLVLLGVLIGLVCFNIWVVSGVWEDLGYMMEYGLEDAGVDSLNDGGEGTQLGL